MLVGGGTNNKVNGTPTKKVSFVTNGDNDDDEDDNGEEFDIDFEDDNELSVDGNGGPGLGGHEVTPEVSERAERLEKAKQNPNVSWLSYSIYIGYSNVVSSILPQSLIRRSREIAIQPEGNHAALEKSFCAALSRQWPCHFTL